MRNLVLSSVDGDRVRVRVTNAFGVRPLQVGQASVAIAGPGADIVAGTVRKLTFRGMGSVRIPAGQAALSDPVRLTVKALQELAVSIYVRGPTGPATQHYFAEQTNYVSIKGNYALTSQASPYPHQITCWMFLDGVDVKPQRQVGGAVVAIGDSTTDGYGSTPDANHRWTDFLARWQHAKHGPTLSVLNAGIAMNTVLKNQSSSAGPSAFSRLYRDALSHAGVRDIIMVEGLNDIGGDNASADQLIRAYKSMIARAHHDSIDIFGGTLTPFGGSSFGGNYGTHQGERQRQAVNQ